MIHDLAEVENPYLNHKVRDFREGTQHLQARRGRGRARDSRRDASATLLWLGCRGTLCGALLGDDSAPFGEDIGFAAPVEATTCVACHPDEESDEVAKGIQPA
jgi:cytochrome c553